MNFISKKKITDKCSFQFGEIKFIIHLKTPAEQSTLMRKGKLSYEEIPRNMKNDRRYLNWESVLLPYEM